MKKLNFFMEETFFCFLFEKKFVRNLSKQEFFNYQKQICDLINFLLMTLKIEKLLNKVFVKNHLFRLFYE